MHDSNVISLIEEIKILENNVDSRCDFVSVEKFTSCIIVM